MNDTKFPFKLPEPRLQPSQLHESSIRSLALESVRRPLLPTKPRILLVLLRSSPSSAHLPSLLQLLKVLLFHLLSPAPIVDVCIFDITTCLENIPSVSVLKESIHLLQTTARSFRIHEYHEWQAENVEPEEQ